MADLFGNEVIAVENRTFTRDTKGRFSSRLENAEREIKVYQSMYKSERSRTKGIYAVLHRKDEEIMELKERLKKYEDIT